MKPRAAKAGSAQQALVPDYLSGSPVDITTDEVAEDHPLGTALLALNNAHEIALSRLNSTKFLHMVAQAFIAKRIGQAEAFLIAFDQSADYDSANFLWFRARFEFFIYVDRLVVAPGVRGRGYARRLYQDLFVLAGQAGHVRVVCEVNSMPPNPESDAFHAALGFTEIGAGTIHGGLKTVRYLSLQLTPDRYCEIMAAPSCDG